MRGSERNGFAGAVLRAVTWQAVAVSQALGLLFALAFWLERLHRPAQPRFIECLLPQVIAAVIAVLAAFAGDEAVRRGSGVLRAFLVTGLGASLANVLGQSLLSHSLGVGGGFERGLPGALNDFLNFGGFWGTAILVFMNRRAAQRLLTRLRAGELERVQAERRLTASRLAAAESQIDSSALLRQLSEVRDLYEAGRPEAEQRFETLITGLRETLARTAAHQAHDTQP